VRDRVVRLIVAMTSRRRSGSARAALLAGGLLLFLVVIPFLLGVLAHRVLAHASGWGISRPAVVVGSAIAVAGLAVVTSAVSAFWRVGNGTPVPIAGPQVLVRTGPYAHVRNPIHLGACLYYLGIGTALDSPVTGAMMLSVMLVGGTIYYKLFEEKELSARFGGAYEEYRKTVPFLVPRIGRRRQCGE
jgi:protein-S-isoprenylcysteine O-methyltransferase Ste14